jgi:hypothetical protein
MPCDPQSYPQSISVIILLSLDQCPDNLPLLLHTRTHVCSTLIKLLFYRKLFLMLQYRRATIRNALTALTSTYSKVGHPVGASEITITHYLLAACRPLTMTVATNLWPSRVEETWMPASRIYPRRTKREWPLRPPSSPPEKQTPERPCWSSSSTSAVIIAPV